MDDPKKSITEETTIGEIMKMHPEAKGVLTRYRLDCYGCLGAEKDSLRNVSVNYGIDLGRFLRDLNEAVDK